MKGVKTIWLLFLTCALSAFADSPWAEVLWTKPICVEEGRYIGWPTVCRLRSGELLAVFSGDRIAHVCPSGKVQMVRSSDDGETWSKPVTIRDSSMDDRDAGIVELRDGTLLVNTFSSHYYARNPKYRAVFEKIPEADAIRDTGYFTMRSTDGGRTWGDVTRTMSSAPHGFIELRDGRILTVGRRWNSQGNFHAKDPASKVPVHEVMTEVSSDGGRSWQVLSRLTPQPPYRADMMHEPHVVELPDGTLVAQIRYHDGERRTVQCESSDGGKTWSDIHETGIIGYPSHLLVLRDGRLLCTYASRKTGSCGEYACVSSDGGKTWNAANSVTLSRHSNDDLGYPSTVQLGDGTLLTVYYQPVDAKSKPCLMATKWRLVDWPAGKDPKTIAARVIDQFLASDPLDFHPVGFAGHKGYGDGKVVHYPVVSLWVNAIEHARLVGDKRRLDLLVRRFDDFLPGGKSNRFCSKFAHVDYSIFGSLPYEVYLVNGDKRCLEMGARYADGQWTPPDEKSYKMFHSLPKEEQDRLWEMGFTPQTRLWIDDMYMIIALQSQAYRATGDRKYIDRTAKEMCYYLDRLQLKEGPQAGLFYHAPDAPFVWGRGDGWMAAGMALVLSYLPDDSEYRARIMEGYLGMMTALRDRQREDGRWNQLLDVKDDPRNWAESSCTAMFAYAFAEGVKHGWLDAAEYAPRVRRAYLALVDRLDRYANVPDVCTGTGKRDFQSWYFERPRVNGDPHGQAALLWVCNALVGGR